MKVLQRTVSVILIIALCFLALNCNNTTDHDQNSVNKSDVTSWKRELTDSVMNDYLPDKVFDGYRIANLRFICEDDSPYITLSDGRNYLDISSCSSTDFYTLITDFSDPDDYAFNRRPTGTGISLPVYGDKISFYPSDLTEEIMRIRTCYFENSKCGIYVNLLVEDKIVTYSYIGDYLNDGDFLKMIRSTPKIQNN